MVGENAASGIMLLSRGCDDKPNEIKGVGLSCPGFDGITEPTGSEKGHSARPQRAIINYHPHGWPG